MNPSHLSPFLGAFLGITFVLSSANSEAQTESSDDQSSASHNTSLSFYGNLGFPMGEFKSAVDNKLGGTAIGLGVNFLANIRSSGNATPFWLGVDFSYNTFGRDKIPSTSTSPPYKTTFNQYAFGGAVRITLGDMSKGFTPFIDGTLGMRTFNTRTKIDKNLFDAIDDSQPEVIHNSNDWRLGYSAGVGFKTGHDDVGFTLRILYLWGYSTTYVKRGSMEVDQGGLVTYETGHTNANMIQVQLGVIVW